MRKFLAIATFIIVAGLTAIPMSASASGYSNDDSVCNSYSPSVSAPCIYNTDTGESDRAIYASDVAGYASGYLIMYWTATNHAGSEAVGSLDISLPSGYYWYQGGSVDSYPSGFSFDHSSRSVSYHFYYDEDTQLITEWIASSSCGSSCFGNTRIFDMTPDDGAVLGSTTASTSPITFQVVYYIAPEDVGNYFTVGFTWNVLDQNTILSGLTAGIISTNNILLYSGLATTSGWFYGSTTQYLAQGNYSVEVTLDMRSQPFLGLSVGTGIVYDRQVNQFIVGSSTWIGDLSQNSADYINTVLGQSGATTTVGYSNSCIPIFGYWDAYKCMSFMFVPDQQRMRASMDSLYDNVLTHFPLGYVTDFLVVLSTTTVGSMPVLDITIPNGMVGAGATLDVNLANSLDFILYATSTWNLTGSSTETFYDVTSYYWNIFVYLALTLYIISRLLGSHVIPTYNHFGDRGALSDNSSSDDSYKLKEWLYKNRK